MSIVYCGAPNLHLQCLTPRQTLRLTPSTAVHNNMEHFAAIFFRCSLLHMLQNIQKVVL